MAEDRGVGLKGWLTGPKKKGPPEFKLPNRGPLDRRRLAVLPFANMSPDPRDEYFADGMMEEIITRLSSLSGLRVVARTSSMKYKDVRKSVSEIGSELSAGSALQGSVRKAAERVRITLQLIDTSTEEHLWANSYDRNLTDIFAVQTDIAENVANSLELKLLAREIEGLRHIGTRNSEAYTHYMRARELMSKASKESMREAKRHFDLAIEKDPAFARAYAGLADWTMSSDDTMPRGEARRQAKVLVTKALELDSNSAEAHSSMGLLLESVYDWKGAEHELKIALSISPGNAEAHRLYSLVLANLGKFDEMLSEIRVAIDLDPFSASLMDAAGYRYSLVGNFSEALRCWERALELSPDYSWVRVARAYALVELGRTDEGVSTARSLVKDEPENASYLAILAYALARTGKAEEARPLLKRCEELKHASRAVAAEFWYPYVPLGDFDKAFELVGEALEKREIDPSWIRSPIHFAKLRSDTRYAMLLRKYNMETTPG